jgi:hypothetical protein
VLDLSNFTVACCCAECTSTAAAARRTASGGTASGSTAAAACDSVRCMSPTQFERHGGRAAAAKWRSSLRAVSSIAYADAAVAAVLHAPGSPFNLDSLGESMVLGHWLDSNDLNPKSTKEHLRLWRLLSGGGGKGGADVEGGDPSDAAMPSATTVAMPSATPVAVPSATAATGPVCTLRRPATAPRVAMPSATPVATPSATPVADDGLDPLAGVSGGGSGSNAERPECSRPGCVNSLAK